MTTSNTSSSSDEVATALIYSKEEDAPAIKSVVAMVLLVAAASTADTVSRTTVPTSCATPATEPWGLLPSEVPWASDPWGEGMTFGSDALESRSRVQ
jgi:hypothetical protein